MKSLFFLLLTVVGILEGQEIVSVHDGKVYAVSRLMTSQRNASDMCEKEYEANLVVIPNEGEQNEVARLVMTMQEEAFWIALRKEQAWQWPGGIDPSFTKWRPSDEGKGRCVAMDGGSGMWLKRSCEMKLFFVCSAPWAYSVDNLNYVVSEVKLEYKQAGRVCRSASMVLAGPEVMWDDVAGELNSTGLYDDTEEYYVNVSSVDMGTNTSSVNCTFITFNQSVATRWIDGKCGKPRRFICKNLTGNLTESVTSGSTLMTSQAMLTTTKETTSTEQASTAMEKIPSTESAGESPRTEALHLVFAVAQLTALLAFL